MIAFSPDGLSWQKTTCSWPVSLNTSMTSPGEKGADPRGAGAVYSGGVVPNCGKA
jgi:hypothetical protein